MRIERRVFPRWTGKTVIAGSQPQLVGNTILSVTNLRKARRYIRKLPNRFYRRLSAKRRVLPDFLIIGTQKGGTTSLYAYLSQHPEVLSASEKEVHYFDRHYRKGLNWYRSHFALRSDMTLRRHTLGLPVLTGESTPYYLFRPHAARRIRASLPRVKLIVLLRNPVTRAYSHYQHEVRGKREWLPFREAIQVERARISSELRRARADEHYESSILRSYSYVTRGMYISQIKEYHFYFNPLNLLILSSEDFFADVRRMFAEVESFLGLEHFELQDITPKHVGHYASLDIPCREKLEALFQPYNEQLYEYLNRDFGW